MTAFEKSLQQLYQAPLASFLEERKRLAAELRARGDDAAAAQIAKRPKPVTSVWTVNQLYWREREAFDEMLEAASLLRRGDNRASKAYHGAIANLRQRAAALLKDAGFTVSDATLRRVATTLAAIAAVGGFEPDPPGAIAADRDPPGFDAVGIAPRPIKAKQLPQKAHKPAAAARERVLAQLRAAAEKERQQREAERTRRKAERSRLQTALRAATSEVEKRERALSLLQKQARDADNAVADARESVKDLKQQLAKLEEAD